MDGMWEDQDGFQGVRFGEVRQLSINPLLLADSRFQ